MEHTVTGRNYYSGAAATAGKNDGLEAGGRNQGNNIDFGMDIAIPQNRFLLRPSHLKLQYTYTVGNSSIHQSGATGGASRPAIDYPDTGTSSKS